MAHHEKQYYLTDNTQLINASATEVFNLSKQLTAKPSPIGQHLVMQLMMEKMGPGDSARLHMADKFIYINEGINGYTGLLKV